MSAGTPGVTELMVTLTGKYSTVTTAMTGTFAAGTITGTTSDGQTKIITFVTANGGNSWDCTGVKIEEKNIVQ